MKNINNKNQENKNLSEVNKMENYNVIKRTYIKEDLFVELIYIPRVDKTTYQVWTTQGDGYGGDTLCEGNLLTYNEEERNTYLDKYNEILKQVSSDYSDYPEPKLLNHTDVNENLEVELKYDPMRDRTYIIGSSLDGEKYKEDKICEGSIESYDPDLKEILLRVYDNYIELYKIMFKKNNEVIL